MTVTGTSAGAACDASNFAVRQYSGPYPLRLRPGMTAGLRALGVSADRRPQLQFLDKPLNSSNVPAVAVPGRRRRTARSPSSWRVPAAGP